MPDPEAIAAQIDLTPFHEPALFAIGTALYWYHVHGRDRADLAAIRASLAAVAERRPWTAGDAAAWPAMLLREALRRLATPYALAMDAGTQVPAAGPRLAAVRSVMRAWPELRGLHPA